MEPEKKSSNHQRDSDVDLSYILYKLGKLLSRFFVFLASLFTFLGELLLQFIFFLRRNFIWLVLSVVIGISYGYYQTHRKGSSYYSDMTVRTNFNSSRALYNSVDFVNALISSGDLEGLSSIFQISTEEANSLSGFEITPVKSELVAVELYNDYFLKTSRNTRVRMDTFWTRTVSYEEFKKSLTPNDYPLHEVKATSSNPRIFAKLGSGLIKTASANAILQKSLLVQKQLSAQQDSLLTRALSGLDTLRSSYNSRLSQRGETSPNTNLNLFDKSVEITTPELDLYDKLLQINDELATSRQQAAILDAVIQVYAPFSPAGQKAPIFRQSIFQYAYKALLLALIVLFAIASLKFLKKLEQKEIKRRKALVSRTNVVHGSDG